MIFSSVRWRLQIWHGVLLLLLVSASCVAVHRLISGERLGHIDGELQNRAAQLAVLVPPEAGTAARTRPAQTGNLGEQITAGGVWFVVWQADGKVQSRSVNAPAEVSRPARSEAESRLVRTRGSAREVFRYTPSGRCFLVGRDISEALAASRILAWQLGAVGTSVLLVGLLTGWWISTRALRPIGLISATAEKIATGNLSQRIDAGDFADELRRLADVLNSTFSRLDASFAQQGRFTADAAHELRTPVSVILMHAQDGLASAGLSAEARESFEACARAAQRMRRLIESLLQLARLDAGQERVERQPCDLAVVARECVELIRPLAEKRHIVVACELRDAPCHADGVRIAQVVTNFLTNAVEHCRGNIRLSTRTEDGSVLVEVADDGAGVAPGDRAHIFDRFYRADTARANGSERNGLGLAISKAIVEAHGGTIVAGGEPGKGATFTVRIPA